MLACYDVGSGFEDDNHRQMKDGKVEETETWGVPETEPTRPATARTEPPVYQIKAPFVGGRLIKAHVPQHWPPPQ